MGLQVLSILPNERSSVVNITSSIALTKAQHDGAIINVNHVSGVSSIDLPAAADAIGMTVTIVIGQIVTSDFNIDGQGLTAIKLHAICDDDDSEVNTIWSEERYIVYDVSQGVGLGVGVIGDICELVCNGVYWIARSHSRTSIWKSDANGTI